MCWVNYCYTPLKVASHDIPVFKVCRKRGNRIFPYYQYDNLKYIEGKTYVKDGKLEIKNSYGSFYVKEGFHSYGIDTRTLESGTYVLLVSNSIHSIFHAYSKRDSVIALCIIPKGSTYVINSYGEYVSDELKVVKFLRNDSAFTGRIVKRLNEEILSFSKKTKIEQLI